MITLQKFKLQSSFRMSLSWPLNVSIITKEYYVLGIHFSFLTFSKYGSSISMKNTTDLEVILTTDLDQWFSVNYTKNDFGKLNFGKLCFFFPRRWFAFVEFVQLQSNVAIICCLSSTSLTGVCLLLLKWNVYFPGER